MAQLRAGFDHLPLGEVIRELTGVDLPLYRDQLEHSAAGGPVLGAGELPSPACGVDGAHAARRRLARLPAARACWRTTPP